MGWLTTFLEWSDKNHIGDLSGLVGLAITCITILMVGRVRKAINRVRNDIQKAGTAEELSGALSEMKELRSLNFSKEHRHFCERCVGLRLRLVGIRTRYPRFSKAQSITLQGAIRSLREMEEDILEALARELAIADQAERNKTLNQHLDELQTMLVQIQLEIGKDKYAA